MSPLCFLAMIPHFTYPWVLLLVAIVPAASSTNRIASVE